MFAALDSQEHSARKRMIANVYSKSYIQHSEDAKSQARTIIFERLMPLLRKSALQTLEPNGVDVQSLFLATTMDFISAYVFGLSTSTNFIQDKGYRDHWLELYNARNNHHFWPQEMPVVTKFFQRFGIWLYPRWVDDANEEMGRWNLKLCNAVTENKILKSSKEPDDAVVFNALNLGIDKEVNLRSRKSILHATVIEHRDRSVASELFDHVLAGHETAGIALTYLAWHLSKSVDLQTRLRTELLTLQPNMKCQAGTPTDLPNAKDLDSLPLLHAVVMETLRLHAPLPGPQPRRTPNPSCVINGVEIPGDTRIAALAYTLHRDERVFPEPLVWRPERWLPDDTKDEERRERQRHFWAFGSGGRMCIGSNFAMNGKPSPVLLILRLLRL
jgi:cytochrome P450